MSLHQSKVSAFALSLGFMPLGVAHDNMGRKLYWRSLLSLGFMPLGVAHVGYEDGLYQQEIG